MPTRRVPKELVTGFSPHWVSAYVSLDCTRRNMHDVWFVSLVATLLSYCQYILLHGLEKDAMSPFGKAC
ncbi:hypothetical protein BDZ85DRAFT_263364 [Elsinoe ampelina]|uniref:Uncharacterized protein n=1 Tax=Elsinoe ampelina TaxID=302913 RepID=A0A6A6G9C3_9PEZI|nr:hypothetical protein BDZ85DRAFT_263364 [Elsinoe ampelina]